MHIETLATFHNRCEKTIQCLTSLHQLDLPEGLTISHNLVDDGSSDQTVEKVRELFPNVNIITGTGNLFWAGGMRYGWQQSIQFKSFDYLFVFNDDCVFYKTAIKSLLNNFLHVRIPHVIVGSFQSTEGCNSITYGGRRKTTIFHPLFTKLVTPNAEYQKVDTLNMNGALLHKSALSKVGFLSNQFKHSQADFEYGLKVRKAGGEVLLCPDIIGECDVNLPTGTSLESGVNLINRYKRLFSSKEQPFKQGVYLYREHGGLAWPIFVLYPYLKVTLYWLKGLVKKSKNFH